MKENKIDRNRTFKSLHFCLLLFVLLHANTVHVVLCNKKHVMERVVDILLHHAATSWTLKIVLLNHVRPPWGRGFEATLLTLCKPVQLFL